MKKPKLKIAVAVNKNSLYSDQKSKDIRLIIIYYYILSKDLINIFYLYFYPSPCFLFFPYIHAGMCTYVPTISICLLSFG